MHVSHIPSRIFATLTANQIVSRQAHRSDTSPRSNVVVVGNGPVGFRLLEKIVDQKVNESRQLIVCGEEPRPAYDRVKLTSVLEGRSVEELEFASRDWYSGHGIDLRTGDSVVAIDRLHQVVRTRGGAEVSYDTLILATGSKPLIPPIKGSELPGVFVYRTVEDLERIRENARTARSVAVLGGGLLGLEAARALHHLGLTTHVIEMASVLMSQQLDNAAATLLGRMVEALGVHVHLTRRTSVIIHENEHLTLRFDDDQSLTVDMVVISAGIRPRDELARSAGLAIGPRGGINVDDQLRTSDPRIFAIGECALHREKIYGLAAPGYRMAEVLADVLGGGTSKFTGCDESTRLKLFGVDVSLCGDYLNVQSGSTLKSEGNDYYRKLIVCKSRVVGVIGVGPFPELPRIQEAISRRRWLWGWQRKRFERVGRVWGADSGNDVLMWPAGAVVCSCTGTTLAGLRAACARGCDSVESLARETKASTVCGSCRPLLAAIAGSPMESTTLSISSQWLLVASLMAVALTALMILCGPIHAATSVQDWRYQIEFVWRDAFWKQVSGYIVLSVAATTLLLPLRKRGNRFRLGDFGVWRAFHATIGVASLVGLAIHTGMHLGRNLNLLLMVTFLVIQFSGGVTGLFAVAETRTTGVMQRLLRSWRPRMTLLHILCLWPFPVLLAFHIVAVYYF